MPATLWLALILFDGFLMAQVHELFDTTIATGREHDWLVRSLGFMGHAG